MELPSVLAAVFGCLVCLYGIFVSRQRELKIGFFYSLVGFGLFTYLNIVSGRSKDEASILFLVGSILTWRGQLLKGEQQ